MALTKHAPGQFDAEKFWSDMHALSAIGDKIAMMDDAMRENFKCRALTSDFRFSNWLQDNQSEIRAYHDSRKT